MVFQAYHLFPHRTVLENVMEGPVKVQKRNKEEVKKEAVQLLQKVGLEDRSSVVLPEPEGPKMAITFPFSMFRSIFFKISFSPKDLFSPLIASIVYFPPYLATYRSNRRFTNSCC